MKLSRIAGAGAVAALVAASTLLGAGAAQAADIDATGVTIGPETNPYGTGWFSGDGTTGSATQTPAGLQIDGTFQLLNGTPASTDLVALADGAVVDSIGDAYLQIPVFGEPGEADQQFTTLRPADPNAYASTDTWVTSRAFGAYAAQGTDTLVNFASALSADAPYRILAFGVFVNAGDSVTLRSLTFSGDTHFFVAAPKVTVSPKTITAADTKNKGLTITLTGFTPGETIYVGISFGQSGGDFAEVITDENGTATLVHKFESELPTGTFEIYAYTGDDEVSESASDPFTVVANPAPAATLPDTGVNAGGIALLAGALLLAGAGVFALRRRVAAE